MTAAAAAAVVEEERCSGLEYKMQYYYYTSPLDTALEMDRWGTASHDPSTSPSPRELHNKETCALPLIGARRYQQWLRRWEMRRRRRQAAHCQETRNNKQSINPSNNSHR